MVESPLWASVVVSRMWSTDGGRWLRVGGRGLSSEACGPLSAVPCILPAFRLRILLGS